MRQEQHAAVWFVLEWREWTWRLRATVGRHQRRANIPKYPPDSTSWPGLATAGCQRTLRSPKDGPMLFVNGLISRLVLHHQILWARGGRSRRRRTLSDESAILSDPQFKRLRGVISCLPSVQPVDQRWSVSAATAEEVVDLRCRKRRRRAGIGWFSAASEIFWGVELSLKAPSAKSWRAPFSAGRAAPLFPLPHGRWPR